MPTLNACLSIVNAQNGLIKCSLNQLLLEYNYNAYDLTKVQEVLKALNLYNVNLSPPFSENADLELIRVLMKKRTDDLLNSHIEDMLKAGGENSKVELKSSIAIDTKHKLNEPGLELAKYVSEKLRTKLAQEICAFLNSDGGELFIGITNDHEIVGCADDFKAVGLKGSEQDQADLIIRRLVNQKFHNAKSVGAHLQVQCTRVNGRIVIIIEIASMQKLAFLKPNSGSSAQLYKRIGTNAEPILLTDIEQFYDLHSLS